MGLGYDDDDEEEGKEYGSNKNRIQVSEMRF